MSEPLNIKEQIELAVSLAEGQFREFKSAYEGPPNNKKNRSVRDISKDVGECLVAFANADGGELLIGVEDDGQLSGVDNFSDEDLEKIRNAYRTHVHKETPLQSVLCREAIIHERRIIYFRVPKGTKQIHLTSDGRCLKRNDLETIPVPAEQIQFDRREVASREFDREFVDGASVADLEHDILKVVAGQVSAGISIDKCLQYLGLAEYDGAVGLRLRRAALLLFSKTPDKWHPRLQVRILKVSGTSVGAGANYNVSNDNTIKNSVLGLIDEAWDGLRPYLVATRFQEDARFRSMFIYPEAACREALVNAIAHRDYSEEGSGIEIYVFDDRIEIKNPGGLLSSISVEDIKSLSGVHQSRNSYVARALREVGLMRELGEGMRRIFEVMKHNELAPPEIVNERGSFTLRLHHRPMYAKDEILWLEQYDSFKLTPEEKAILLLGRKGDLISTNNIWMRLGIVDTEHYRQVLHSLQTKGIIESAVSKVRAQAIAKSKKTTVRDIPRFRVRDVKDIPARSVQKGSKGKAVRVVQQAAVKSEPFSGGDAQALYIGNIPPNTTRRDLINCLTEFGQPANIVIPMSGRLTRGYAFVEFDDAELSQRILGSEIFLGGRKLVIRWKLPWRRFRGR